MARRAEHLARAAELDDAAGLHDGDPVGDLRDHPEIMGDEQDAHMPLGLDALDQRENLRLSRDVECGRRLVRDEDGRFERERHCDHGALALASGKLVGIRAQQPRGLGQLDGIEELDDACEPLRLRHRRVHRDDLVDLVTHPLHGFRAVIGSWKIMEIWLPRSSRSRFGVARRRSSPRKRILPALARTPRARSPMMARDVMDLPEPDSPTRQRISLWCRSSAHVAHGVPTIGPFGEVDREVVDFQDGRAHRIRAAAGEGSGRRSVPRR